ncbi:uncharacterized protein [Palaemon carinicauda]|uniref:uncharacterized protein n=1 Tax=Palaemon carinicauda TaxID=392227 RepID=UPI0035B5D034
MLVLILCLLFTLSAGNPGRSLVEENSATKVKSREKNPGLDLPCGEHFLPLKQTFFINSEREPSHCQWIFKAPGDNANIKIQCKVRLRFSKKCKDASVQVFDGWRGRKRYCGTRNYVENHSGTGVMIVTSKAQTRKFTTEELGTFSCEVKSELKVNFFVNLPVKTTTTPSPLPPPLLLLERVLAYITSDPND